MYSIMIIEDDKKLNELIKNHLERYGYRTFSIKDFSNVRSEFVLEKPELILMDVNLPVYDGFYWCRDIRTISKVPIIFISARDSDMDQVMAIENGADDYITKPFSYDVLMAKIKGVLRRVYGSYSNNVNNEVFEAKGLFLYINQSMIEYEDKKIELSKKEFQLLYSLIKNADKIVSRETLLDILWNDVDFVDDNTLSVNMTRVRKRLESIGIYNAIETKRGQGYKINVNW
ncbi:DNA-binding response OmpR family regulator [Clostridium acetobutylicum]|uniref:Stage 0 sporulation protein A homolog n=1 Tax=Clostridium acetobutylicum (strain ATCC 824 / DSM 792 / JCM 1419 / IAM 19013 / LMG 5710 / NBRC 13948 / NRRL B-527 / VKM B-1787 / 2291 / W) TaxID=272562 RepID=Q97IX4_CLOAB|nr:MULTISPECIES: response regulator transcription factor [Clostridium]AAK79483.1 Response regulator (CheY-like receiver domain and HTH DNA-binding domain) [Clostridium acetobutylicum ATCC 824]ADZ20568.1 Response regulator (CheY-like receiver domain and HTH DNA-binding domain) [Clostridium acetobutylicum EA 2018]AEI31849.1 response regulator [Clostridium acetobutylicum DSM 1731]AWV81272.1 DNA-binding response regulator [Clostridium acetobutylicum]MBC2392906.1 response regulator transcription fa